MDEGEEVQIQRGKLTYAVVAVLLRFPNDWYPSRHQHPPDHSCPPREGECPLTSPGPYP